MQVAHKIVWWLRTYCTYVRDVVENELYALQGAGATFRVRTLPTQLRGKPNLSCHPLRASGFANLSVCVCVYVNINMYIHIYV